MWKSPQDWILQHNKVTPRDKNTKKEAFGQRSSSVAEPWRWSFVPAFSFALSSQGFSWASQVLLTPTLRHPQRLNGDRQWEFWRERERDALKFLLKIPSVICDSVLTMQMTSGCGKRINCDEYSAVTTFLAQSGAPGSQ